MRKLCILAVALCSLTVVSSAAAQVVAVPLSFNNAVLTTPGFKNVVLVSPNTNPITATAQFDTSTGAFTIAPGDFSFPTFSFTTPVPGTLHVSLNGPATGQFNPTTGAITVLADFVATINLNGVGSCAADSGHQTYSTSNSTVYPGVAFPATPTGPVTGPGAFTGGWSTVQATGSGCSLLASALDGPGGLWISKNVNPPAAKLSMSTAPRKTTRRVGRPATIKVTIVNAGNLAASDVSVCVSAPKAIHIAGAMCRTASSLAAGKKQIFTFKAKSKAAGKFAIRFEATATGVSNATRTVTLKVRK